MQTFLPYADYDASARVLDPQRLGNQLYREGLTILRTINRTTTNRVGWSNHPAVNMWRPYKFALCSYLLACVRELARREHYYPEHKREVLATLLTTTSPIEQPVWLGDVRLHASHRSNLLRKDRVWYERFGWQEPSTLPYYWPTHQERNKVNA